MEQVLFVYLDVNVVYVQVDMMVFGVMIVLWQVGKQCGVMVVLIDGIKDFVIVIVNGLVVVSVEMNLCFGLFVFKLFEVWFVGKLVVQKQIMDDVLYDKVNVKYLFEVNFVY